MAPLRPSSPLLVVRSAATEGRATVAALTGQVAQPSGGALDAQALVDLAKVGGSFVE